MSVRSSFLSLAHQKTLRCEKFLTEMNAIIPWNSLLDTIEPYYIQQDMGRKRKELKMMLRIYFLQQWFGLADEALEDAVYDSQAFRGFLGLDLGRDAVPDATTLLKFRHLLEKKALTKTIFDTINQLLREPPRPGRLRARHRCARSSPGRCPRGCPARPPGARA